MLATKKQFKLWNIITLMSNNSLSSAPLRLPTCCCLYTSDDLSHRALSGWLTCGSGGIYEGKALRGKAECYRLCGVWSKYGRLCRSFSVDTGSRETLRSHDLSVALVPLECKKKKGRNTCLRGASSLKILCWPAPYIREFICL